MTAEQQAAVDRKAANAAAVKADSSAAKADETPTGAKAQPTRTLSNLGKMRYSINFPAPEPEDVKRDGRLVENRMVAPPYSVAVTSSNPHMIAVEPDSPTEDGKGASGWLVGQGHGRTQTGVVITATFTRLGRQVRTVTETIDLVDDGGGLPPFPVFELGDAVSQ